MIWGLAEENWLKLGMATQIKNLRNNMGKV
jgi:hypothetical protein